MTHAAALIAGQRWWHTIDIAPDLATPGAWDLRPMAEWMPWPSSLAGARCLDVGTMDGFWVGLAGVLLAVRARLPGRPL